MKITSTDDPNSHVGLGKGHFSLILVLLLTFLVVINLVLTHIYSSWTPFVPTVPAVKALIQLRWASLDQVVLQFVLPCKALVTVITWTGVGTLPRVQQLVPSHMLRTRKLLPTYITGVFVVHLRAVRLHVLSKFAEFEELLSTLVAREHSGTSVARTWKLRMASTPMPRQPALSCEGLKASRCLTVEHCKPVCSCSQCLKLPGCLNVRLQSWQM